MSNSSTDSTLLRNPYVGPRTFQTRHRNLFFGRDREARDLLSLVIAEPLVLFTAQSGAGKSSLINTRLIPGLHDNGFEVLPVGRVGSGARPEEISQANNVYIFNLILGIDKGQHPPHTLANLTLDDYLRRTRQPQLVQVQDDYLEEDEFAPSQRTGRVLIIDQFEEIITTHHTYWPAREGFFRQLNTAIRNDPFLWVVLTMREDYVASLDPYLPLLDDQLRTRFYMQRMGIAAAREAIEKPAANRDRPFAPGVSAILIDNLRQLHIQGSTNNLGQYVEPVQLQVVCHQLWNKLQRIPGDTITLQNMEQALGYLEAAVDSALGQFYQQALELVKAATTVNELTLRNWFEFVLITTSRTRGTVYRGQRETAGLPNEALRILDAQFLLRTERRAGAVWYELIHDRFIDPILQSNHQWRLRQNPLLLAADKWERAGRSRHLLYEGNQLEQALAENRQTGGLNSLITSFLQASEAAQVDKKLEVAQQEEAEKIANAAKEATARRREQRRAYAIGIMFAIGIILTIFAILASQQANQNLTAARLAEQQAQTRQSEAQTARSRAIESQNSAQSAQQTAVAEEAFAQDARNETNVQRAIAVTAQAETIQQKETAEAAQVETILQQRTAQEAQTEANIQEQAAQESLEQVQAQQQTLLAQYLAFQALNITRQNNDTELAMLLLQEATEVLRENWDDQVYAVIQRSLLPIYEQPYFNTSLSGHEGAIRAIAFSESENGITLVSAGVDGTIRLWSLDRPGEPEQIITGNEGTIDFIDISTDGKTVAAANRDGTIHLWKLEQSTTVPTFTFDQSALGANPRFEMIQDLALSPNGAYFAVAIRNTTNDGTVTFWTDFDTTPRSITPQAFNTTGGFEQLIFNADSSQLFAYAYSEIIPRVFRWSAVNPNNWQQFNQGDLPLAFSSDNSTIYYDTNPSQNGFTGQVTFPRRTSFYASTIPINGSLSALSDNGSMLATVTDTTINLWQPDGNNLVLDTTLTGHTSPITDIVIAPDGQTIASAARDGTIRLWQPNGAATAISEAASLLAIANDQLVMTRGNTVQIGSTNQTESLLTGLSPLAGLSNQARSMALSPDGRQLVIGGGGTSNGSLTVWDLQNPAAPPSVYNNAHDRPIAALAFSPDGQLLASGSGEGTFSSNDDTVRIWNPADLTEPLLMLEGQGAQVIGLAFVPYTNNQELVSINSKSRVTLWDLTTGIPTNLFGALSQVPSTLAISPDGRWLAVGTNDSESTLYVWDLHNRSLPPLLFIGHDGAINSVIFNEDSNTVVTGGADGTIRLWQPALPSAAPTILRGHDQPINVLVYTSDGLLLSSDDTQTLVWSSVDSFLDTGCNLVQRNLTALEWQLYVGDIEDYEPTCDSYPVHYTITQ